MQTHLHLTSKAIYNRNAFMICMLLFTSSNERYINPSVVVSTGIYVNHGIHTTCLYYF